MFDSVVMFECLYFGEKKTKTNKQNKQTYHFWFEISLDDISF